MLKLRFDSYISPSVQRSWADHAILLHSSGNVSPTLNKVTLSKLSVFYFTFLVKLTVDKAFPEMSWKSVAVGRQHSLADTRFMKSFAIRKLKIARFGATDYGINDIIENGKKCLIFSNYILWVEGRGFLNYSFCRHILKHRSHENVFSFWVDRCCNFREFRLQICHFWC